MTLAMKVYVLGSLLALLVLPGGCPTADENPEANNLGDGTSANNNAAAVALPEVDLNDPVLVLLGEAEVIVEQGHPRAVLIEAVGEPAGDTALTAGDLVKWTFFFMEDRNEPAAGTVILTWEKGQFGAPTTENQGIIGTMYERLPRTMTITTAIQFMRDAGYDDPFSEVVLRKPLTFPIPAETYYIFEIGTHYVLVGMKTGEVTLE